MTFGNSKGVKVLVEGEVCRVHHRRALTLLRTLLSSSFSNIRRRRMRCKNKWSQDKSVLVIGSHTSGLVSTAFNEGVILVGLRTTRDKYEVASILVQWCTGCKISVSYCVNPHHSHLYT
jgi:hypothetical protein